MTGCRKQCYIGAPDENLVPDKRNAFQRGILGAPDAHGRGHGTEIGADQTVNESERKDIRYCPYCGMSSFEVSGDEEGLVYCEYCGVDVDAKELIP